MLQFVVISYSLLALALVLLIFGKKGKEEDNNLRRMKSIGKEVVKTDYKKVDTSFKERVVDPVVSKLSKMNDSTKNLEKNQKKSLKKKEQLAKTARLLRQAGLHTTASSYQFFKMAFMIIAIIIFVGLGVALMDMTDKYYIIMLLGIFVGVFGPDLFLKLQISKQQSAIKSQIPDALDLLVVCMEAGLSFDASLLKISERMEGPFIDELMTVFRQIQLGKSRNEALKNLSDSTDIPELKTFLSALMQANKLGIPISNVMKVQSDQLRNTRAQEIKTKAAAAPTKMTIPTVALVLPTLIIMILAPTAFNVIDSGAL